MFKGLRQRGGPIKLSRVPDKIFFLQESQQTSSAIPTCRGNVRTCVCVCPDMTRSVRIFQVRQAGSGDQPDRRPEDPGHHARHREALREAHRQAGHGKRRRDREAGQALRASTSIAANATVTHHVLYKKGRRKKSLGAFLSL